MKELELLDTIKKVLTEKSHIGDDCAYLEDLGVVVTQDSMVEDVHFSHKFSSPYQLGYKAMATNLSDIFASGAVPAYATISLSLPSNIDESFIKKFYKGCDELAQKYRFEVVGGDITGGDKIFISVCMIGKVLNRKISSRKKAKVGDLVVTTGDHGSSAAGLWILKNLKNHESLHKKAFQTSNFVNIHLNPIPQKKFSYQISETINRDYAMMDSSDGLMDAVYKIAQASNVLVELDFNKIPFDTGIKELARMAHLDYKDWIFYGGEDYQLVACIDKNNLQKINADYTIIGEVKEKKESNFVQINFDDSVEKIQNLEKTYNHFREY